MRIWTIAIIALLVSLLLPHASGCSRATVIEGPTGQRCYVYWNELQTIPPEFWIETNGRLDGGDSEGIITDHWTEWEGGPSGLQRYAYGGYAADTKASYEDWALRCGLR